MDGERFSLVMVCLLEPRRFPNGLRSCDRASPWLPLERESRRDSAATRCPDLPLARPGARAKATETPHFERIVNPRALLAAEMRVEHSLKRCEPRSAR